MRLSRTQLWALTAAFALVGGLALSVLTGHDALAFARPGGGQGFNGRTPSPSPSPGGGSSGGGGGFALWLLFNLLPWPLKILLVLGILFYVVFKGRGRGQLQDWSTMGNATPAYTPPPPYSRRGAGASETPRQTLARLRQLDPSFSLVLFEDFLYALYAEAHERRAAGQLDMLSAYLGPDVIARMNGEPKERILGIVIGGLRFENASLQGDGPSAVARVTVSFEVNLTVEGARGPLSSYLVERWSLVRRASAKSRPADKTRVFDCPNCGAPQSAVMAGKCSHCNQNVATGNFGWLVDGAVVVSAEPRPPLLTTEVEERGNDLPTLIAPDARANLDALWQKDQSFQWQAFEQRVALVFNEFQTAWSARDLAKMRPFLSDNLFQMQAYWTEAYKAQRLRNVTENARIERIELARLESDAHFDAITIRLWASSLDYTITDEGKLVTGSKSRPRSYSEYWTFIRGSSRKGPTRTEPVCPNCGAPLAINQVGICEYCKAKVTSGEFDWVLSRIEQDEAYTG